jgi:TetR/AcrR family transcriptional repressor of nem operon
MARPRAFDETDALDKAVDCFWQHGYAATSVRDLAGAMGISGPSLYNTFGDKRSLFVGALERYLDRSARQRMALLEETLPGKQAVKSFFAGIIERSATDRDRRGCFLINSALEVAPHDAELGAEISRRLAEIEAFFRRAIQAGQARSKPERALLEGVARPALALLD